MKIKQILYKIKEWIQITFFLVLSFFMFGVLFFLNILEKCIFWDDNKDNKK